MHTFVITACDRRPVLDITQYEQHIGNGHWIRMPCAPGTAFSMLDCECALYTGIVPGYGKNIFGYVVTLTNIFYS